MSRLIHLFVAATIFLALPAAAQVDVDVVPASPTSSDEVVLRISPASGWIGASVTRTGNHFRLDLQSCPILCVSTFDVSLGTLPGGTYTFEVFDGSDRVAPARFLVAPDGVTVAERASS